MSLNHTAVSGYLGKAAELRYTKGGTAVASFSMAVNERRKQADGSYADKANWLDCVMFGSRAEALLPYLAKGTKLAVGGRLRQTAYEHDGQRRSRVEIVVDEVELMNARREPQQPDGAPAPAPVQAGSMYDEDIAF